MLMSATKASLRLAGPKAADRRGFSRRSSLVSALLRTTDQATGTALRVNIVDYSYGGICFLAPIKLTMDEHVLVDMQSSDANGGMVSFEAIVRWVDTQDGTPGFRTGCAWIRQLTYMELRQLR
jgi:hypothetical protein